MHMAEQADPWSAWSFHVELGRSRGASEMVTADSIVLRGDEPSAPRAAPFELVVDRTSTSVSLRNGVELSPAMRDWIIARHVDGAAVPHDVHLTMRDRLGKVVARWCLRRAGVAKVIGADLETGVPSSTAGAVDELVLTCERIDLELTPSH